LNTQSIKFTTKLFTGILAILVLSIVLVVAVTTVDVRKGLFQLGQNSIENTAASVMNSLEAQNSLLLEKLTGDVVILGGELERYGSFDLYSSYMLEPTITNQVTKAKEDVPMPRLMLGGMVVNGNTGIVDKIQGMTGGVTTIFQVLGDKLLRVSTNVATSSSMTHSISTDIEKVRAASDEMTTSSRTVQESATELSRLAERLREQVGRFKI